MSVCECRRLDAHQRVAAVDDVPFHEAECLIHLQGLRKLKRLYLSQTDVTDAGLEHLKRLNNLRLLDLGGTRVTDEGVKEIQHALPDCAIVRWGRPPDFGSTGIGYRHCHREAAAPLAAAVPARNRRPKLDPER